MYKVLCIGLCNIDKVQLSHTIKILNHISILQHTYYNGITISS